LPILGMGQIQFDISHSSEQNRVSLCSGVLLWLLEPI
jgi:hypothetical protein